MVPITALWLPILLSTVLVFFAGFVLWVLLPHHRSDWTALPDEDAVMDVLREQGAGPGMYHMPHASSADAQKDPAWQEKVRRGPTGFVLLTSPSQVLNMGSTLGQNFLFILLTSVFVAYLSGVTLPAGAEYGAVFQVAGTAAMMTYVLGHIPKAIFWGWGWGPVVKEMGDGVIYGLLTAGAFAGFWPG